MIILNNYAQVIDRAIKSADRLNECMAVVELDRIGLGCGYSELSRANLINMATECLDCNNSKYLIMRKSIVSGILLTGANGKIVHEIVPNNV